MLCAIDGVLIARCGIKKGLRCSGELSMHCPSKQANSGGSERHSPEARLAQVNIRHAHAAADRRCPRTSPQTIPLSFSPSTFVFTVTTLRHRLRSATPRFKMVNQLTGSKCEVRSKVGGRTSSFMSRTGPNNLEDRGCASAKRMLYFQRNCNPIGCRQ